ncbi:MAG: hypothetical protein WCF33_01875 [Pseudonocardiaceae bacterium]
MDRRTACGSEIVELNEQEAEEAFDAVARREMGISGPEFLRRGDAGYYTGQRMNDIEGLAETWMVVGLVR